jgi:hypothetical protein
VVLTGSHFLHKNIFVKRNIHCYLNKFYEINSLYLYYQSKFECSIPIILAAVVHYGLVIGSIKLAVVTLVPIDKRSIA